MYFVAIVLPEHLNRQVLVFKKYMLEKHGCRVGLKSPAHITIIPPFWMDELHEPILVTDTAAVSSRFAPFEIATANFACFRPRTIFIDVRKNSMLDALKAAADDVFHQRELYGISPEDRPFRPHITIATRDLPKHGFAASWPYFAEKIFEESWTAEGLSILRHNRKEWEVLVHAPFAQENL